MNNDLISRSALIARHCDGCAEDIIQSCKTDPLCAIMMWVVEEPAVDAVEVVHGEWITLTECSNEGVYCSVCHKKVYKVDYARSNKPVKMKSDFCPNCGADMRERKGDE